MEGGQKRKIVEEGCGKSKMHSNKKQRVYRLSGVIDKSKTIAEAERKKVQRMLIGTSSGNAPEGGVDDSSEDDGRANPTCFRSNIQTAAKDLKEIEFTDSQLTTIKRTPFWFLFKVIYQTDATKLNRRCAKHESTVKDIIAAYDDTSDKFIIGGKVVDLTSRDLRLFSV